jgi:hypothetical protein
MRRPALDRLPLEETIDRDDAAPPPIGAAEGRHGAYGFILGIDRLTAALRVFAPIGE